MRRFLDASTVLYAVLEPAGDLPEVLQDYKKNARQILGRINKGEAVVTSVIHLSEVANILEARKPLPEVAQFITDFMAKDSIESLPVTSEDYRGAAIIAHRRKGGINDALAKILMDRLKITEIYSFDKHFDNFNVKRVTE